MKPNTTQLEAELDRNTPYSEGEKTERRALGLPPCEAAPSNILKAAPEDRPVVSKKAIMAPDVLNEAPDYGETLYPGDFRAQLWRTYRNITRLLESEGATWHDIVRTTCYIRDIERDYAAFNEVRNEFFRALGLDPFPASTGIQARICRSDLLIEIEALAILIRE